MSVGQTPVVVTFDEPGSYLIIGKNGAGKSTLGEALCFALYGKPYRKINKPQLVNTINKRELLVELEFTANGNLYLVRRGIKPSVFEVLENGKLINQEAKNDDYQTDFEKKILRMNFQAFKQIVMLGSTAYVPFMELKTVHRREMIEDLLDSQIYTIMSKLNSKNVSTAKERSVELQIRVDTTKEKIRLVKENIQKFLQNTDELVKAKKLKLVEYKTSVIETIETAKRLQIQLESIQQRYNEASADAKQHHEKVLRVRNKILDRQKQLSRDLDFFEHTNECPTCAQAINELYRNTAARKRRETLQELSNALTQVDQKLQVIQEKLRHVKTMSVEMTEIQNNLIEARTSIKYTKDTVLSIQSEIQQMMNQRQDYVDGEDKVDDLEIQLKNMMEEKKQIVSSLDLYKIATQMLKDTGIKAQIVKKYIPIINKFINKYLAAMDFFVEFELDENFEEVIKSRHRDEFSYHSFSEGEKFRIDLALLLTWRAVARMRNSCMTNLLFLDEIFDSSLDTTGIDEFMKLLDMLVSEGATVMVVSHKGDQLRDKFENVIRFDKVKNFTQMVEE